MATVAEAIRVEPTGKALGARIIGVDLRTENDEARARRMRAALARHMVLCFPGQKIEGDDQIRFARMFGQADADFVGKPTFNEKVDADGPAKRGILFISNLKEDGKHVGALPDGEMHFHSDGAHRKSPYRATTLYAIKIPSRGGDTLFANLADAYDDLPPAMKQRVESIQVHNVYDTRLLVRTATDVSDERVSKAVHPIVRVHPDSGRRSLYLSRLMTHGIIDMSHNDSEALLEELFQHIEQPKYIYAHEWALDDLLIWDNRSVNHARSDFPANEERHLRRVTVSEPNHRAERSLHLPGREKC